MVDDSTMLKKVEEKEIKKCEIESDTNLETPKVSQELLGFRISSQIQSYAGNLWYLYYFVK